MFKTYLRLIQFAKPIWPSATVYIIVALLATTFGIINFTLLIPLLDILFGNIEPHKLTEMMLWPEFSLSGSYLKELFYYFLANSLSNYGKIGAIKFVCITLLSSVVISNVFRYIGIRILEYLRARTIYNIRKSVFDKVASLHLGYFTDQRKGDLMSRMTTDIYELEFSITNSLFMLMKEPVTLLICFSILFGMSVKLTLFTIILLPTAGYAIGLITKKLKRFATLSQKSMGLLTSILDETLSGLRVIKSFNALQYIRLKFDSENLAYSNAIKRMARTRELASPISEILGITTVAFILLYGGRLVLMENPELSPSQFITYIAIFSQILNPAKAIATAVSNIQRGLVSGQRVMTILDSPTVIDDKPNADHLISFDHELEFLDVWFRYENDWILKGVSFKIQKGMSLAIVGPSGGGKSTIADLIPRFYEVEKGEVLIDGKNIKNYSMNSLLDKMGIVTQENILFNDTIFNNIAFGKENARLEEVKMAASVANANEFIMQTPNGYNTVIGDRGVKLSGGQRQRLTIARAVYKNPPILILDEATSALDTESEKLVQQALENLMKNRTSIVIAHRLSTIQHCNEILVLDKGLIVEKGTHNELFANQNGMYRKLLEMQKI